MSALRKRRSRRDYVRRAQSRAERRVARAKERALHANKWPPEPESDEAHKVLRRMFRGVQSLSTEARMSAMERGRKVDEAAERTKLTETAAV